MGESMNRTQLESLMTARQVADFLQVSVCTIGRWSRRGAIKFYRVGGRGDMRYRLEDVLSFISVSSSGRGLDKVDKESVLYPGADDGPAFKARGTNDV